MLTIFIFIFSSTFYSKVLPFIELVFLKTGSNFLLFYFYCSIVFIIILYKKWGLEFLIKLFLKGRAHNCTSSKNCHCGSCQCSVDPVLSSHDALYFETYLSSQAFFTFVTTLASMEVCFTLFLYPFPSTVQNYIQLSPCTTNPWKNELPGITNYTILQNKRMRRCGCPSPTNNFR